MPTFRWRNASDTVRYLMTAFYLTMAIGYVVALANAQLKMGGTVAGLVTHFRGTSDGSAYPKGSAELIEVAHAHGFSVPLMYLVLGILFLGTQMNERWKRVWTLLPFAGVVIDQIVPWLLRYHAPWWAWVMVGGHALSGTAFAVLIGVPLWELWGQHERSR